MSLVGTRPPTMDEWENRKDIVHMYVKSKIKIHLNNGNGLLFLMAVFLTTFYLYKDLGISTLLGWGMVLVFAMINFILRMSYKFSVILPVEKISYIFIVVIIGSMSSRKQLQIH